MRNLLARIAAPAPARVFAAPGVGGRGAVHRLRSSPEIDLVASPRSAEILLLTGRLPESLLKPAIRVHDQMPPPRATVCWDPAAAGSDELPLFPDAVVVGPEDDPVAAILDARRARIAGRRGSDRAIQPDHPPASWRGIGPHGQGGEGMAGGKPYGRPLPERGPARDGLELDRLELRVGPFFPPFPPGLVLELLLQGDVIQEATLGPNPFVESGSRERTGPAAGPFAGFSEGPAPIAEMELARARHHLSWLAHALGVHGLPALGRRVLGLAARVRPGEPGPLRRLERLLERGFALGSATAGVGVVDREGLDAIGGPVARSAGVAVDARAEDPAYREIGFEPVTRTEGDARARLRQRLAEAAQALELAAAAGERRPAGERIEGPRGPIGSDGPARSALSRLPRLLVGLEWGDATTTVVSLDLDLEEEASGA